MSAALLWASPGGQYRVPDGWRQRFLADFPDYRVRWSLRDGCWQIEQRCGRSALPPVRIDPHDDSLIRAADGYWLVMAFQPGDRMACPAVVDRHQNQRCGATLAVSHRKAKETVCRACRAKGRDGRTMAAFWPFDELLLEELRRTDPLRIHDGRNGIQRASAAAAAQNARILAEAEWKRRDAVTSIDAVDYRWLTGIPSTTGRSRRIDATTFR